jgi:Spy/CpxP family protein refolding chaperone
MTREQRVARTIGGMAGVLGTGLLLMSMTVPVSAADEPGQGPAQGQEPPRGGRPGPRGGGPFGERGFFGRGGMNIPGLTEAQREQVRGVAAQHRDELRGLAEQVMTARQALQASVATGQVDEGKATELGTATAALALAGARARSEIRALLTPEQRQRLDTRRADMRTWMESRPGGPARRGGRGGPNGPGGRRQR